MAASVCLLLVATALLLPGCGKKQEETTTTTEKVVGPELITAYEAMQYCKPAADRWQENNWVIQVRDGDPDGMSREGKARIWEVYFFSPKPEETGQMFVIYNRGHVWPNTPGMPRGGDKGVDAYRKNKPKDLRVDSPEAISVAMRNGGGEFRDSHADAQTHVVARCKADYDAVSEKMPAPKYKWIWDVSFKEPKSGAEVLHVMVDGMNGDFITKETKKPPS